MNIHFDDFRKMLHCYDPLWQSLFEKSELLTRFRQLKISILVEMSGLASDNKKTFISCLFDYATKRHLHILST